MDHLEGQASSNGSRPQASNNGKKGRGRGKGEGKGRGSDSGGRPLRTWTANPKLFPCEVTREAQKLMEEVQPLLIQTNV